MTCDSGRLRNGGDAKLAPCAASQSGNRPNLNRTTQLINHLLTDKGDKGLANGCATAAFVLRIEPLRVSTKGFNRLSQGEEQ